MERGCCTAQPQAYWSQSSLQSQAQCGQEDCQVQGWSGCQGFSQVEGLDFDKTYLPVAHLVSLCLFLAITTSHDHHLHQMDAKTAFLNGKLDEEIYMCFPPGYQQHNPTAMGLRLVKLLYGLKQSPRMWWKLLNGHLESIGFRTIGSDWGLYHCQANNVMLLLYMDNVLISSPSMDAINNVKALLMAKWKWADLGKAAYIPELKVERDQAKQAILLSQAAHIARALAKVGLENANLVGTPLENTKLEAHKGPLNEELQALYCKGLGILQWILRSLHSNITFAVSLLTCFASIPNKEHCRVLKRVFCYLKGTSN